MKVKGFVTADYIISSLRQQMLAAGCLVQEDREEADYVVEARVGALGTDAHDVNYGVPANKSLSTAASLVAGATAVPTIPEISVARRADESAAAKLALFAYDRQTRERVWQSGMKVGRSSAQDRWYFGAGPFQSGTIYEDYFRVQDQLVSTPLHKRSARSLKEVESGPDEAYRSMAVWNKKLRTKAFEFAGGTSTDGHTGGKEEASATEPTNPATTDRAVQPASHGTRVSDKP